MTPRISHTSFLRIVQYSTTGYSVTWQYTVVTCTGFTATSVANTSEQKLRDTEIRELHSLTQKL